jgi:hypothetical protein
MYAREQKAQLVKHGKRLNPNTKPVKGTNRRTIALLPDRKLAQADLLLTRKSSIYQQLLNIEANKLSCLLKITSPKSKSRSALLIYEGQVLGCVYGSKKSATQLFGLRAYEKIIAEITRFDNFVEGYMLSPQMALAAGSMFHEQVIQAECDESPVFVARRALNQFEWGEAAGCIVITNEKNDPLSVMYFSERTLVGAQLLTSEKAPQELTKLWQYLEHHPNTKVYASMLSNEMINSPGLTFSLSGLNKGDTPTTGVDDEFAFHEVAKLTIMHVMRTPKEIQPVSLNRFVNVNKSVARPGQQPKLNQRFRGVGFYYVDPR